jgi:hypothetical protein
MGKHLSIKEKLNAENEYEQNLGIIYDIKDKIRESKDFVYKQELWVKVKEIRKRNKKLLNHIYSSRRSKHRGLYGINGICYNMFGKKSCELNKEERTEYNKIMKARQRKKNGNLYDREYHKRYYLTHKEQQREKAKLWRAKNKDKVIEQGRRKIQKHYKQRGYGAYQGSWTFKTFGKRYVDMTEEEKRQRQIVYKKMKSKEMIKSE